MSNEIFQAYIANKGKNGKNYYKPIGRAFTFHKDDETSGFNIPNMNIVVFKVEKQGQEETFDTENLEVPTDIDQ